MKVNIQQIESYDFDAIYEFVSKLKLRDVLAGKKTILLKPNLLGAFPPEKAVTTHPVVVDVVITYLKELGKKIIIGDSPGGSANVSLVWEKTGLSAVARKHNIELVSFRKGKIEQRKSLSLTFPVTNYLWDVDAVINLSKYKTHSLMYYTGAVKNLYGLIPGLKKSDYHKEFPDHIKFGQVISELYALVKDKIAYNIMDGIIGMEGEGPSAGKPRNFGVMFASRSATALDAVASKMMGFKLEKLDYLQKAMHSDSIKLEDIELLDKWKDFRFNNVKVKKVGLYVKILAYSPKFLKNIFQKSFNYHPDFNDKCKKCRICVDSCPMQVMSLKQGDEHPVIDHSKCIKCMCCHEMCPYSAIFINKSFLAKFIIK